MEDSLQDRQRRQRHKHWKEKDNDMNRMKDDWKREQDRKKMEALSRQVTHLDMEELNHGRKEWRTLANKRRKKPRNKTSAFPFIIFISLLLDSVLFFMIPDFSYLKKLATQIEKTQPVAIAFTTPTYQKPLPTYSNTTKTAPSLTIVAPTSAPMITPTQEAYVYKPKYQVSYIHNDASAKRYSAIAEENHKRVLEIQAREKECHYWRTNAIGYSLKFAANQIRKYCGGD